MKILDRIKSRTPKKDKKIGKAFTVIGTVCGAVLATGLIVNPFGIVLLTVGAVLGGGKALYHAQKTEENVEP